MIHAIARTIIAEGNLTRRVQVILFSRPERHDRQHVGRGRVVAVARLHHRIGEVIAFRLRVQPEVAALDLVVLRLQVMCDLLGDGLDLRRHLVLWMSRCT